MWSPFSQYQTQLVLERPISRQSFFTVSVNDDRDIAVTMKHPDPT